jgi:hypothetical protein
MKPIDDSLIDTRTLFVTCGGDPQRLKNMIYSFRTHFEGHLDALANAIKDQDGARLSTAAHKLHGLVSAFSRRAVEAVTRLERVGIDGHWNYVDREFVALHDLLHSLAESLHRFTVEGLDIDPGEPLRD